MASQLSRSDFQQLIRVVQNLPDFANVRDRRRLVAGALEGVDRADTILARLDLDGAPMGVAVESCASWPSLARWLTARRCRAAFSSMLSHWLAIRTLPYEPIKMHRHGSSSEQRNIYVAAT